MVCNKIVDISSLKSSLNLPPSVASFANYVYPLEGSGDILFSPLRPSVFLSVTKSCLLFNLITVRGISTKLHTFVKHIQTTCHAQEP